MTDRQWLYCRPCQVAFMVTGLTLPCPVELYLAALRMTRCPKCGGTTQLDAYQPGMVPPDGVEIAHG